MSEHANAADQLTARHNAYPDRHNVVSSHHTDISDTTKHIYEPDHHINITTHIRGFSTRHNAAVFDASHITAAGADPVSAAASHAEKSSDMPMDHISREPIIDVEDFSDLPQHQLNFQPLADIPTSQAESDSVTATDT